MDTWMPVPFFPCISMSFPKGFMHRSTKATHTCARAHTHASSEIIISFCSHYYHEIKYYGNKQWSRFWVPLIVFQYKTKGHYFLSKIGWCFHFSFWQNQSSCRDEPLLRIQSFFAIKSTGPVLYPSYAHAAVNKLSEIFSLCIHSHNVIQNEC